MAGLATIDQHQQLWDSVHDRRHRWEQARLAPPRIRLWDGDYRLRGEVAGERSGNFEFVENDVGTAEIVLPLDHYLARWIMGFKGRDKRNVHVTFDKQGARWAGCMSHYRVVRDDYGDTYLEAFFLHDMEHLRHIYCWSNPFLRAELQFPKLWIVFGPAKFCLLLTLWANLFRLETSLWTLPDNPLDPTEWMGLSFLPRFWRQIVKPFPLIADNSPLTLAFSRFQSFYDMAKATLTDAQLTMTCRRYLHGEDPHPFKDMLGVFGLPNVEDLFQKIPLRHGVLVWDITDNSGWGSETAFGGSLLTGLVRAIVNIASDGMTEGIDIVTGDATFPGEYWNPGFLGTRPQAPWVVFEDGEYTGIKTSEFKYHEATSTSFLTGGRSMPGINEGIEAGINIGFDLLTSAINSSISGLIDLPPLGGMVNAVVLPLVSDVLLAFTERPTLRAAGLPLPLPGLEHLQTGLGEFHYYESWCEGGERAFTLSALMAIRSKMWETRAHVEHTITVSDAAPYLIGEEGYGHFWLGSRVATSVRGFPDPDTLFVERVQRIRYEWDGDGPKGWKLAIGRKDPEDPVVKLYKLVRDTNQALGQLGIL